MRISILYHSIILVAALVTSCADRVTYDIIIEGGTVIDGTGAEGREADVAVLDGKIVRIGDLENEEAKSRIDAHGLTVTPGFIDLHTHLEPLMELPDAESHVRQGVTLALGGPDGNSPWPLGKYLDSLYEHYSLGMNVAYLVGHNTIRRKVMGNINRAPTHSEMDSMKAMVVQSMREGAFGISTGLKYLPGAFAETEEVIELSKVAAGYGGIYTSHLREEGLGLLNGVREAIRIGYEAKIPIVLTHHKAIGKPMWGQSIRTTAMVDSARALGIDVMMDQYPYTASHTGLAVLFPSWAMEGSRKDFEDRVADPSTKTRMLAEILFNINNDRGGGDLRLIQFSNVAWDSTLNGKTLHDYAIREGIEPTPENGARLAIDIQLNGGAGCIFHAISPDDVERIMKHPYTMHASDGRLTKFGEGHPHPRAYGTFPRVLGYYVREKKVITLEDAIHKMTGMPADRLGLQDRGYIREGFVADITIFDAKTVKDMATFEKPHQYPIGIEYVLVGGIITVSPKGMTGEHNGMVLRGPGFQK